MLWLPEVRLDAVFSEGSRLTDVSKDLPCEVLTGIARCMSALTMKVASRGIKRRIDFARNEVDRIVAHRTQVPANQYMSPHPGSVQALNFAGTLLKETSATYHPHRWESFLPC